MSTSYQLSIENGEVVAALQGLLKKLLAFEEIGAILVSQHLPMKSVVMPSLISDATYLDSADPLSPSFPVNAAKLVSKLTRKPSPRKTVAVLRSCEIRAFTELVKLKQGSSDQLIILGVDCLGAYSNRDFMDRSGSEGLKMTERFVQERLAGSGSDQLASACQMCEQPIPHQADLRVGLYGADLKDHLLLQASGAAGELLLEKLQLKETAEPIKRADLIKDLLTEKAAFRDKVFTETGKAVASMEGLNQYLADCVNCYNCRVACPVCYCKECVMLTDVFDHDSNQYLQWSAQRGFLKMPTDTTFYHMTRLTHMSLSCVGCGQCTNACPNDIPLTELFRTIAHQTQQAFEYEPGHSLTDPLPLSLFEEDECQEVVGIKQKRA